MSKVKIEGNASGTGTLTISAPNTNTDRSITLPDGAGEIITSSTIGSNMPSGSVLQVQHTWTDDQASATTSWVTAVDCQITPSSTSNKVLVIFSAPFSVTTDTYGGVQLLRYDGSSYTAIGTSQEAGVGGSDSNYFLPMNIRDGDAQWEGKTLAANYLDSPSTTSTCTYILQFKVDYGSTMIVNRPINAENNTYHWNATSNMTLMEIAG